MGNANNAGQNDGRRRGENSRNEVSQHALLLTKILWLKFFSVEGQKSAWQSRTMQTFAKRRSNWYARQTAQINTSSSSSLMQTMNAWSLSTFVLPRFAMLSRPLCTITLIHRSTVLLTPTSSARASNRNSPATSVASTSASTKCTTWRTTERTFIPLWSLLSPFSHPVTRVGPKSRFSTHAERLQSMRTVHSDLSWLSRNFCTIGRYSNWQICMARRTRLRLQLMMMCRENVSFASLWSKTRSSCPVDTCAYVKGAVRSFECRITIVRFAGRELRRLST